MENQNGAPETQNLKEALKFIIEGKDFETFQQYKTGAELKEQAGIPLETVLYLSIKPPYEDEEIGNEKSVDLARPGTEYFYVRRKLKFTINGEAFEWYKQYISGHELRKLGKINPEDELYLKVDEGFKDELIGEETLVDLARSGVEHFYSKACPVQFILIINGRERSWDKKAITFEQVIQLAFPNAVNNERTAYTVTYIKGPKQNPEGSMVKGSIVYVTNKMIFNATATDKS